MIFVVIILVILIRKLRVIKMYSRQNNDLIKADITLEHGITVFGHPCCRFNLVGKASSMCCNLCLDVTSTVKVGEERVNLTV